MPGTAPTRLPATPAEVAAAILDMIEQYPEMFDMGSWATLPSGDLEPQGDIPCGTTMCIAGWAAHLTGYTLHTTSDGEGVFTSKDGVRHEVETVAAAALGLTGDEPGMFWWAAPEALKQLRKIAGR
ncbi:hypothetical protein ACYF6T_39075 [Streptomyces sp. 7R007]